MAIAKDCFKAQKGFGLQVSQVVFDAVKELQAAGSDAPAAGSADGSATAPAGSAAARRSNYRRAK